VRVWCRWRHERRRRTGRTGADADAESYADGESYADAESYADSDSYADTDA